MINFLFAVVFRMLATESAWNPESLFDTFLHRLSEVVKDELVARELPGDIDSLIALTIRIDGCMSEMRSGIGDTHSSAVARSPSKESGSPRRLFFREDPKPPELPRESSATGESDTS